jgi:RNA polymerase sigma-70 factor (ECF subfamily)
VSEPPGTAFASRLIGLLPSLRRYARAISGDAALADDLVQDSIERALARAATLRQPDRLGAWMRGIVHNLYLDELRRRRVRGVRVDVEDMSDDLALSTHAGGGAPDHAPLDAVARAMQGLSLEHRQILVLAGVEELPYRAIAEELQVPMGTVMSRLARARAALRRALESGDPAHGELHAFIDGELPPDRAESLEALLASDPALAARLAAFADDKDRLAAAFRPSMDAPVPDAWIARIQQAAAGTPRRERFHRTAWALALAACVLLALGATAWLQRRDAGEDRIVVQANAARLAQTRPVIALTGALLDDGPARDSLLTRAVGLPVHAPDLARLGWILAEIDTYTGAAALRYRAGDGRALTLYVRKSSGAPRFDLFRIGTLRACIWQDDVVGAVRMGDMSAGQMMRVAGTAYVALDL